MLTLMKNYIDENKSQKRINVKKIISLKELTNKQIKNITFKFLKINLNFVCKFCGVFN